MKRKKIKEKTTNIEEKFRFRPPLDGMNDP